jgi:lysylphosphatidylglycerol synthetase-like protein (DUF2156 family)
MGLLLFAAAVLPPVWLGLACVAAMGAVALVARRKPGFTRQEFETPARSRRWVRTALGMAIALGVIVWALLSNRHG